MSEVPAIINDLVERFDRNRDEYRKTLNETQTRVEFIDPFFEALGWDIANRAGYAEDYKDVIHEAAVLVGGVTNAPDYCFRIGGRGKFFLEAKSPGTRIGLDHRPAYQLRRYAWNAKHPLAVLTNFDEFSVYDGRFGPEETDGASAARVKYIKYTEYLDRWTEIAEVFAKESILRGSFDQYAETEKGKRGTAPVDVKFLEEIEQWRESLAHNIKLRNPGLSVGQLNFAVQKTIDRIIFLRMCEDRGIEQYGQLQGLCAGHNTYARLCRVYLDADDRYNSGLFHFALEKGRTEGPDDLTLTLSIDDKVLKDIIRRLYFPKSPYEFRVISADILGNVYEQFLGKVIIVKSPTRADVEPKPEVKKAGGVYYTPGYIVDYIVKNTVGKLCEGRTPRQVSKLRVVDPACGSGSFLIGAYTCLLDWHRDWYVTDGPEKHKKEMYQGSGGRWLLTTAEKKRILLNNVYGVDIDSQAVEVTKLNLLLKVLEGETRETLHLYMSPMRERTRALPDLGGNIKCGNSLIGSDFFEGRAGEIDREEQSRVNPFDWDLEFPDIMKSGGFDAVIGNPPYIRVRLLKEFHPEQVSYLEAHYRCAVHVWDIYLLFIEKVLELARTGGRFGFIVPVQTLHQPNCESLRELLLARTSIDIIVDLSQLKVFQGAIVKNCIVVCEKGYHASSEIKALRPSTPGALLETPLSAWPQKMAAENPGHSLKLDLISPTKGLCDKLRARSVELSDVCYVTFGLRSCAKGKGEGGKDRLITRDPNASNAKPYLEGREIGRYRRATTDRFIRYEPEQMYSPRSPELFEAEKIISQTMLSKMRLVATYDEERFYVEQSLLCIVPHGLLTPKASVPAPPLKFILGVLNSELESYYFRTSVIDYALGGGLVHATPGSQSKLVVPGAAETDIARMVSLVDRMLSLHKDLATAKVPGDKTALQRQIDATDREIDALVYELYGLTEEEIKIVEGAR